MSREINRPRALALNTGKPVVANHGVNPGYLQNLLAARRFDEMSEKFLSQLAWFEQQNCNDPTPRELDAVNAFVSIFLKLFCQADYTVSERHIAQFVRHNLTISNLVAISAVRNTDGYLDRLRDGGVNSAGKALALYSARNSVKFDRRKIFDLDPTLASLWYSAYCQIYYAGLTSGLVCRNLREHYEYRDERLDLTHQPQEAYFGSTYVDGECDRLIKPVVNRVVQRLARQQPIRNTPDPRKIAVLSGLWTPNHSVYRNYAHYVRALRGHYHLTFFQLGDPGANVDRSMFDEVRQIGFTQSGIGIAPLVENDFQVAYFPDVGMTPLSIVLANMRLAPIQIASPGHSVSTWGSEIDYFMSGRDVEIPENPERNYSERLVLLPDCGVIHNRPLYEPRGRAKSVPEFVINCSTCAQKVNYRFCRLLQRVISASQKPLRFRFFIGTTLHGYFNYAPFVRELGSLLQGARIEVIADRPYPDYMALMEEGDISIDAFHFGGCNTIADSLFLRIPTVTYEGDKWYNRIGSQMLRMAGIPDLVATNDDEYVRIAGRLIHDDSFRSRARQRLYGANLDATIFNANTARHFREAVDFLIENHERLARDPDRRALRIGVVG